MSLAERYGCTITDFDGELGFKRQVANSGEDLVLEYNKTLVEFYPSTDVNFLVTEVEVRGWDRAQHQSVRGTKTHSDAGSDGGGLVEESFGAAQHALLDIRVKDQNEADQLALDYLTQNARNYIQGYGIAVGNTELRAGGIVKIEGIADRYKGKYYVWAVQHRLEIGVGYTSKFFISSNVATQGNASNTTGSSGPAQGGTVVGSSAAAAAAAGAASNEDEQQPPEPEIINLKWKNMDDEEITEALVGEKVKLTADVRNIDDGYWVRVRKYEADSDNEHDYIGQESVPVKEGKIEQEWIVEYHEDDDDEESVNEESEKGYTMPEYLFKLAAAQPKEIYTDDSPIIEVKDWAEIELIDDSTDKPLANQPFKLLRYGEIIHEGETDSEGKARVENLKPGTFVIEIDEEEEIDLL